MRSVEQTLNNSYTDAPRLHSNLVLGSLQLVAWAVFHPAAWQSYVARIDPNLRPDFALVDLRSDHWRNPALRRLLVMVFLCLPLLANCIIGILLWAWGEPAEKILYGIAYGVGYEIATNLLLGGAVSVSLVIPMVLLEVNSVLAVGTVGIMPFQVEVSESGRGVILGSVRGGGPNKQYGFEQSFLFVSLVGSVLLGIASIQRGYGKARPLYWKIGSFILGALVSLMVTFLTIWLFGLIMWDVFGGPRKGLSIAIFVTIGALWIGVLRLHGRKWWPTVRLGAVIGGSLFVTCVVFYAYGYGSGLQQNLALSIPTVVGDGLMWGFLRVCLEGILFAVPYALVERLAGPKSGTVAGVMLYLALSAATSVQRPALIHLSLAVLCALVGLTFSWWRPVVLYPFCVAWNFLLYRFEGMRSAGRLSLLRWNSAFWDQFQYLPLFGLDDHLVMVSERNQREGRTAIEFLATSRQRWAAQAAQIELDARFLERSRDVTEIAGAQKGLTAGELIGPASALLRSFGRISEDVQAALNQESTYHRRLALSLLEDRLDGLLRELTRSSEQYAGRFRPIANSWRRIVDAEVRRLTEEVERRQEIDSPYVIGVPLTEQQEIFVGRTDISARIERLLLDPRRPPILLCGQRRMGKTSLLNNLGRLLPNTIVPLFVDLQGPASQATEHAGFLYAMARSMVASAWQKRTMTLPPLPREGLARDPFTGFDEWLDKVEALLEERTALLSLDEFEALETAITQRRLTETAVLGMLRHLIQHRPRFKILLAASHTLEELERWSSYLINVQVIHIGRLRDAEAYQLIERPVQNFALRYEPEASRRVLELTRGHPFLLQLLCAEIVALKNEQDPTVRRLACLDDVEAAVPDALSHGSFFFADIERNQLDKAALSVLRFLASQGEGSVVERAFLGHEFPDQIEAALSLLVRRELIEQTDGGYRFQVGLIRRWCCGRNQ